MRPFTLLLAPLLAAGCVDAPAAPPADAAPADVAPGREDVAATDAARELVVTRAMIGSPVWEIADVRQFAAAMGTRASNYAEGTRTLARVLEPGHVFHRVSGLFGPGAPHAGPYAGELAEAVRRAGYANDDRFTTEDFSPPRAVFLTAVLVPGRGAPAGSSADGPSGPVIPNGVFRIAIDMDVHREGALWDPENDSSYPAPTQLSPPRADDGWSHVVLAWADNHDLAHRPSVEPGRYEWRLTALDATRSGWRLVVPFTVAAP